MTHDGIHIHIHVTCHMTHDGLVGRAAYGKYIACKNMQDKYMHMYMYIVHPQYSQSKLYINMYMYNHM